MIVIELGPNDAAAVDEFDVSVSTLGLLLLLAKEGDEEKEDKKVSVEPHLLPPGLVSFSEVLKAVGPHAQTIKHEQYS